MKKDIVFIFVVLLLGFVGITLTSGQSDDLLLKTKAKRIAEKKQKLKRDLGSSPAFASSNGITATSLTLPASEYKRDTIAEINHVLEVKHTAQNPKLDAKAERLVQEQQELDWFYVFGQWKLNFISAITSDTGLEDVVSPTACVIVFSYRSSSDDYVELVNISETVVEGNDLLFRSNNGSDNRVASLEAPKYIKEITDELLDICHSSALILNTSK